MVSINSEDIVNKFGNYNLTSDMMPIEDAYVTSENDKGAINILVQYVEGDKNEDFNAETYIFIRIK